MGVVLLLTCVVVGIGLLKHVVQNVLDSMGDVDWSYGRFLNPLTNPRRGAAEREVFT